MKAHERFIELAECAERLGDHEDALAAVERALSSATEPAEAFRALLLRARIEAEGCGRHASALATYDEARQLSLKEHLDRVGEADLGAATCLLVLDRIDEGRDRLLRAAATFRRSGDALRRGCAELLLGEQALASGDERGAELHAQVAGDLLLAAGEPSLLAAALSLQAELASRDGRVGEAEELLDASRAMACEVADESSRHDLRARRREILRTWLTAGADF